ncbi:glycoside hydrolase family 127 protein [Erwinia pyri]|uniref:Glycoside hydrolase family 127 protein n=1 Tax=Erwinia pyri TaxID=3062598 RepID=A0AA50DNM2_9GAMM|nr:beta-L-arabinofuranosidase domain-containing protein [Erwinia sp. DE2]WLS80248.1 glycoside hydrolase family 127 protein [Erwinia sp. DE2]
MPHSLPKQPEIPLQNITLTDSFWLEYQRLVKDVVVPYQWLALNDKVDDAEPSHAIANFRLAAGKEDGEFYGMVFQDSDVAKWLEAVAYLLAKNPDAELEKTADEVIELVGEVQQPDGYLNTYFTVKAPKDRWTNLAECHELYCAGHLIEAGVAYAQATGKTRLLDIVSRLADHIATVFGPEEHQLQGYPGHPEIELALMRLYEATGTQRYLELTRWFVDARGTNPHYYDIEYAKRGETSYWNTYGPAWMVKDKAYSQAHLPVALQETAIGHAVRFVYLYAGVAHLARITQDQEKREICQRLWENMAQKQLYVTGAIGSQSSGEAFSCDYDLPNDTAYTETCASIGLIMFANRMLQLEADSRYADVMERALYNTVLAGMALDGKHFFYVNPLEVHPESIRFNHIYDHVKPVRQRWFGCACCPPNISRLLASLGHYIYARRADGLDINLYVGSDVETSVGGHTLKIKQSGGYPWQGTVLVDIACNQPLRATLGLRLPDWCAMPELTLNGTPLEIGKRQQNGYVRVDREWQDGDRLTLTLPMQVTRVKGNPLLRHVAGKVAVQRGPLVYCLEEADNGDALHNLHIPAAAEFRTLAGTGLFKGKTLLQVDGLREDSADALHQPLYSYNPAPARLTAQTLTFVPYFSWANRGEGEMRVWINEA